MWNRAFLLMTGMAFGWSLVNYWTAPQAETRRHLTRMLLALVAAGALVIAMGLANPSTIIFGIAVYLTSAMVAYAGNAKQVGKEVERDQLARPVRPARSLDRTAVILVLNAEPSTYSGSWFWAQRMRREPPSDGPGSNWFTRPLAFARIRRAYHARGPRSPLHESLQAICDGLQARLGPSFLPQIAFVNAQPFLDELLVSLAEQGFGHLVLVPVALDGTSNRTAHSHVVRSRVRELGIQVTYADPVADELADSLQQRIAELALGHVPVNGIPINSSLTDAIERSLEAVED